jgi:23S rRNA (cytidine1920-2'-O)/16S rRNA (cytidine1409-2'-O)-methyltransferase
VRSDARIEVRDDRGLRGSAKLRFASSHFRIDPTGLVVLDLGASTGGFTRVLLDCGARHVFAVDVGHGQLLGSLRQDVRVTNLERTNLGQLDGTRLPAVIDLITADLSYISLAVAALQIRRLALAPSVRLVGLVKPMFELRLAEPSSDPLILRHAVEHAIAGVERAGFVVLDSVECPHRGRNGAVELFINARLHVD